MTAKGILGTALAAVVTLAGTGGYAAAQDQSGAPSPEQRQQMREWCKQSRDECRAQIKKRAEEWFKKVDADGDGTISRAEAEAHAPRLAKHFDEVDTDHDGTITPAELKAARKAMRERHGQHSAAPKPEPEAAQPQH